MRWLASTQSCMPSRMTFGLKLSRSPTARKMATGRLRVERPLLVHERAGGGEHAVVQVRAIPRHDQGGGTAGAVTHHRAAIGILGELDAAVFFHQGQHFSLDVLGEESGHGVGF